MTNQKVNIKSGSAEAATNTSSRRTSSHAAGKSAEAVRATRTQHTAKPAVHMESVPHVKRNVTRAPDMSKPKARVKTPSVSLTPVAKASAVAVKAKEEAAPELTVQTVRDKRTNPFPLSIVLTTLFCTLLFMYMVYNYVQINEYSIKVSSLKSDISDLSEQQQALDLQLAKRDDLTVIAEKAEELGMVKLDEVDKIYINGSGSDKVEISDSAKRPEMNNDGILSDIMSAFGQNFKQLAEYLR